MTTIPSQSDFLSLSMNGVSSAKSSVVDPLADQEGAALSFFKGILADIAQDPADKDGKENDQTQTVEAGEMNPPIFMMVDILPKPAAHPDLQLSQPSVATSSSDEPHAANKFINETPFFAADAARDLRGTFSENAPRIMLASFAHSALMPPRPVISPMTSAPAQVTMSNSQNETVETSPSPPLAPQMPSPQISEIGTAFHQVKHQAMALDSLPQVEEWQARSSSTEANKVWPKLVASVNPVSAELGGEVQVERNAPAADAHVFIPPVHVSRLETYLPLALIKTVDDSAAPVEPNASNAVTSSPPASTPHTHLKILTFDLHPAQLGPVTVRMRMNAGHVEIVIDVRTEDARSVLSRTQGVIVEALAGHGLTLEPPEIRLASPMAATEPPPPLNGQGGFSDTNSFAQGQGRAHHDEKSGFRHHEWRSGKNPDQRHSRTGDPDRVSGVYL